MAQLTSSEFKQVQSLISVQNRKIDLIKDGTDYKSSVRLKATGNISLPAVAIITPPYLIDGIQVNNNDRVLLASQTNLAENGIYSVKITATEARFTRATDANADVEVTSGMVVLVSEGASYARTSWKLITLDPIVVGTTDLEFTTFVPDSRIDQIINWIISNDVAVIFSEASYVGTAGGPAVPVTVQVTDGDGTLDPFDSIVPRSVNITSDGSGLVSLLGPPLFINGVMTFGVSNTVAETVNLSIVDIDTGLNVADLATVAFS